ncbi:hypothetical protein C8J57DRAFT_1243493 [Mycena rebaudengoi]|nr:hypothetical protein C8J57DRAFT_1243493 [Mycena rebaudengoi]
MDKNGAEVEEAVEGAERTICCQLSDLNNNKTQQPSPSYFTAFAQGSQLQESVTCFRHGRRTQSTNPALYTRRAPAAFMACLASRRCSCGVVPGPSRPVPVSLGTLPPPPPTAQYPFSVPKITTTKPFCCQYRPQLIPRAPYTPCRSATPCLSIYALRLPPHTLADSPANSIYGHGFRAILAPVRRGFSSAFMPHSPAQRQMRVSRPQPLHVAPWSASAPAHDAGAARIPPTRGFRSPPSALLASILAIPHSARGSHRLGSQGDRSNPARLSWITSWSVGGGVMGAGRVGRVRRVLVAKEQRLWAGLSLQRGRRGARAAHTHGRRWGRRTECAH